MKKPRLLINVIVIVVCLLLAFTMPYTIRDTIIVNLGVRMYSTVRICVIVAVVVIIVAMLIDIYSNLRRIKEEHEEPAPAPEVKASYIDDHKNTLREALFGAANKWPCYRTQITSLLENLKTMQTYKESLYNILRRNDVVELDDTLEILSRIEDCMYKNIDMILNYMEVIDANDTQLLSSRLDKFLTKNAEMFSTAKDLRLAIADYISNSSNGEESEKLLHTINSYKSLLLETVDKSNDDAAFNDLLNSVGDSQL